VAAPKFTVKNILTKNLLPGGGDPTARGKGAPLCLYVCRDDGSSWLSDAEGNMCCLSDILLGKGMPVRAFPAQGSQGPPGKDSVVPGPRGEQGPPGQSIEGRPGRNGNDCICRNGRDGIDGKDGRSIVGPKGDPGDVTFIGPAEVEAAVDKVKAELVARTARFKAAVAVALEKNAQRAHHPTMKSAIDAVLRKLKADAQI
jgi:hypothetical protein